MNSSLGGLGQGLLARLERRARHSWPEVAVAGSGYVGIFAAIFQNDHEKTFRTLILVTIVLGVLGAWGLKRRKVSYIDLEDQIAELQETIASQQGLMEDFHRWLLQMIDQELNLGNDGRLSLYIHDNENSSFQLLVRYSVNPTLVGKGRTAYPDDIGVIARAWSEDWHCIVDLPHPDSQAYAQPALTDYGISSEVGARLTMKPRSIAGMRYPRQGAGRPAVGVLIIESLNGRGVNNSMREVLLQSEYWQGLEQHVDSNQKLLPLLSVARERGF